MKKIEIIFHADEVIREVHADWTSDGLLRKKGLFKLSAVASHLGIKTSSIRVHYAQLIEQDKDPYAVMGVRFLFRTFLVRMTVFAPYYRKHIRPVRSLPIHWDPAGTDHPRDLYYLSDVARRLKIDHRHILYLTKSIDAPKQTLGAWKHRTLNRYVVNPATFIQWIKQHRPHWIETRHGT